MKFYLYILEFILKFKLINQEGIYIRMGQTISEYNLKDWNLQQIENTIISRWDSERELEMRDIEDLISKIGK